jgi:hypothetical protein
VRQAAVRWQRSGQAAALQRPLRLLLLLSARRVRSARPPALRPAYKVGTRARPPAGCVSRRHGQRSSPAARVRRRRRPGPKDRHAHTRRVANRHRLCRARERCVLCVFFWSRRRTRRGGPRTGVTSERQPLAGRARMACVGHVRGYGRGKVWPWLPLSIPLRNARVIPHTSFTHTCTRSRFVHGHQAAEAVVDEREDVRRKDALAQHAIVQIH